MHGETCRMDIMGMPIQAVARNVMAAGRKAVVAIRPERVNMSADGAGVRGEISDIIYLGNARKYVVRLSDGLECVVLRHVDPTVSDTARIGDMAVLSWDARHATAFPL